MSTSHASRLGIRLLALLVTVFAGVATSSTAQTISESTPHETNLTAPTLNIPPNLSKKLTPRQLALVKKATPEQLEMLKSVVQPAIQKRLQEVTAQRQSGILKNWRDIIRGGGDQLTTTALTSTPVVLNSSAVNPTLSFTNNSGTPLIAKPAIREFHGALQTDATGQKAIFGAPSATVRTSLTPLDSPDLDQDGLPDDFENQVADNFTPVYSISGGEEQQYATFGNYVPMTVTSLVGTNPAYSYFRVQPLGLATDQNGALVYALRVDYLSLWNADGGLIGGDAPCAYSYFGLDEVIGALTGHDLDAERSGMLLAAPVVNGGFNPNPNAYSLYTVYTAAHEGTFFDQSMYADFSPAVPAGNHLNLAQSLSKHSTYSFNPDYYPITPAWFIAEINLELLDLYDEGVYDEGSYLLYTALADDTFYGCLVERFSNQGGNYANPRVNVGEPTHPINGSTFIQDDSSRALNLTDKLTSPLF